MIMVKTTSKAGSKRASAKNAISKAKKHAKNTFEKKTSFIKNGLNVSLISSLILLLLGISLVIFPKSFLSILRWIVAISLFLGGTTIFATRIRTRGLLGSSIIAAILIAVGLLFALNEESSGIFSLVLGIWFVINSLTSSVASSALSGSLLFLSRVISFISLVCGILMIINPFGSSVSIMVFLGTVTIISAVSSLIEAFILKKNIDELSDKFSSIVVEGEEIK